MVFILRSSGIEVNYSTALGMAAIGIGGASSALWGVIISVKYKKATVKGILLDFINVRQSPSS
ncbi:MAG: hypothetical protein K2N36_09000 [Ruminiclostridium sp.]|nr:hypothetical protein [Ruminiclostridium sp.]